jgi:peptidoglycan/LPS O-acetylase OafA/YrhL
LIPKNNFDFLRIVFAIFVIITHAYPLSGSNSPDWISQVSRHQMSFSYLGVAGFFAISGYLVMQSLERCRTLKEYFLKRMLRIYPALLGVLLITVLVGPLVYNGSLINYLSNGSAWTYLPFNLSLFRLQYSITGIFENNPFKSVINGSLCTLPYEMLFYILLSVLFYFRARKQKISLLVLALCMVMLLKIFVHPYLIKNGYPFFMTRGTDYSGGFIAGALLALVRIEKVNYKYILLTAVFLVWGVSVIFHFYIWAQYFVLPAAVVLIGISSAPIIQDIKNRIGDISYGVYLYAFPVQQALEHFFKLSYIPLMVLGTLLSLPFAFLSWHLIEKRALKLKQYIIWGQPILNPKPME